MLPGALPDIDALKALFAQHGVLGLTQNFGLGNALCSLDALERVSPGEVHAWAAGGVTPNRQFAPCAVEVTEPGEQVHLRFLAGACIVPALAPSFAETATGIGTWGMPVARALGAQLRQPGVDVLVMPRPPCDLLRAAHAGRTAQLEAAWNLCASNALRQIGRAHV